MSLGVIGRVRAKSAFRAKKDAYTAFAIWVLTEMGMLRGPFATHAIDVRLYLGAKLKTPGPLPRVVRGNARVTKRIGYHRMTIHIAEHDLCDPWQLGKTIVHEARHVHDFAEYHALVRAGQVHAAERILDRTENRAAYAEVQFEMFMPRHDVYEKFRELIGDCT